MNQQTPHKPRLKNLDWALIDRALDVTRQIRTNNRQAESRGQLNRPQVAFASLFSTVQDIGLYLYALGYPLQEIRPYLHEAATYMQKVFELRGTERALPVTAVRLDEKGRVKREAAHPEQAIDYSLTNSASGLQGVYLALIVGDHAEAQRIAELIEDPPNASYIGYDSYVCTPDQQHLAYAVKHMMLGDTSKAASELSLVNPRTAPVDIRHQATMVRGLVAHQRSVFLQALEDLLSWHSKMAQRRPNLNNPGFFINIAALGLCASALRRGLITQGELPQDSVYLPLEMLSGIGE